MRNELLQQLESIRKTPSSDGEEHSLSDLPSEFSPFREETAGMSVGSPGKTAALDLRFERHGDKTHLVDHYDKMPSKVLRAIYYDPELPGLPYVLLLNPSGGILQGDRYSYTFELGEHAHAFLADTEATKIYKMDGNYASRFTEVNLGKDAVLEYISREVIPYARSRWYQCATFRVSIGSRFFFSEIFCPGRIATNEFWDFAHRIFLQLHYLTRVFHSKTLTEFFDLFLANRFAIFSAFQFPLVNDIHCAFRPHHGDFCRRPGVVHVCADML